MPLCPTLNSIEKRHVVFSPVDPEHVKAFQMLCLGDKFGNIRQHPTLRFLLEGNYPDVRTMMFHKVGHYHINNIRMN